MPATTIDAINIFELLLRIPHDPFLIEIMKLAAILKNDDTPDLFNILVTRSFANIDLHNIREYPCSREGQAVFSLELLRAYKAEYIENSTRSARLANEIVKFIEKKNGQRELFDENGYIDSIENPLIKQLAITWNNPASIE